jgi:membrane-associated phospholipid phosphatase
LLVTWLGTPTLDRELVRRAAALRGGPFGDLLQLLTTAGYRSWLSVITIVSSALAALVTRRPLDGVVIACSVLLAWGASTLLKQVFERARPTTSIDEHALGFAMPSGHATSTSALVVGIALVLARGRHRVALTTGLLSIALLMALSRVVLAAHWPTDVLAGICLGAGISMLGAVAVPRPTRMRD